MTIEDSVKKYYARDVLAEGILEKARAQAGNPERLTTADLAPFDDMHIGGRKSSAYLFTAMGLKAGMKMLDVGCGIGGAARMAAEEYGVHVTGIDITPGYKEAAEMLSQAVGLTEKTEFITGDGKSLPFDDGVFDAAYTIHTGMNVREKEAFYGAVYKALKPGAVMGVYDVMAEQDKPALNFPLPWAATAETSFLRRPDEVEAFLQKAGFDIVSKESRREFALEALTKFMAHENFRGRGGDYPVKIRNLFSAIESGQCAPWQIIVRKRPGPG